MKALRAYTYKDGVFAIEGAVSLEFVKDEVIPWRIEEKRRAFYPVLAEGVGRYESGVRLVFTSDTTRIQLDIGGYSEPTKMDCVLNGKDIRTVEVTGEYVIIENLPEGEKEVALWFPQNQQLSVKKLAIDAGAKIRYQEKKRVRWVHYGSSISQSNDARSPARTWVSQVARQKDYNIINLGFSGECVFDPMVGRQISHMAADLITLKLGVNTYPGKSTERLFKPTVIGLIETIREKHPITPIVVISPFYSPDKEVKLGPTGLSLSMMRDYLEEIVSLYKQEGDQHIHYVNGLKILDKDYVAYLPDGLHPNAEAQEIIAHNVLEQVIESLYEQSYPFIG